MNPDACPYCNGPRPPLGPREAKANQTRRAKWARLTDDPVAEQLMRQIIDLEGERHHAGLHISPRPGWSCPRACDLRDDAHLAERLHTALDALIDDLKSSFMRRFGVTLGYFMRFHSRVFYAIGAEGPALHFDRRPEPEPGLSERDRAALAAWLEEAGDAR